MNVSSGLIEKLDKAILVFLCIYALCMTVSTAGANVGLGGACALFLARVIMYRNDIIDRMYSVNKLILASIGCYFLVTFISAIFSVDQALSFKAILNDYIYRPMPILILISIVRDKEQILMVVGAILLSMLINGFWAVGQAINELMHPTSAFRFSGNLHPVHFGCLLAAAIPALWVALLNYGEKKEKIIIAVLILAFTAFLLITLTRGAWISVALACGMVTIMSIRSKKTLLVIFTGACVAIGGLFVTVPQLSHRIETMTDMKYESNSERMLVWTSSYNMFKDYPVTGVGLGCFRDAYQQIYISPDAKEPYLDHAHNNFLQMLAERGVIGFVGFFIFMCGIFYASYSAWKERGLLAAFMLFAAWTSWMIQGMTEFNVGTLTPSKFLWLMMGVYLSWERCSSGYSFYRRLY